MGSNKLTDKNRLSIVNPKLCEEWNYKKNGDLKPENVSFGCCKKVWWKCRKGHEWKTSICHRSKGKGCPYCSGNKVIKSYSFGSIKPKLSKEWHPSKNRLTPFDVTLKSNKKVWWRCQKCNNEWQATPYLRQLGFGNCFKCKSVALTHPELIKEWHPTKNNISLYEISHGSNTKIWWKCEICNKDYQMVLSKRINGRKCNCKVKYTNTLKAKNPKLAQEWHCDKNTVSSSEVFYGSKKKYWWKCKTCGNEWRASIYNRKCNISKCWGCKSLFVKNPLLAKEWHPTKNNPLTPKTAPYGMKCSVWWQCSTNPKHIWKATMSSRGNAKNGCPYCSGHRVCKDNCLSTLMPQLSKEWLVKENATLTPNDVTCGCNTKVWWGCSRGHKWKASIRNRVKGRNCPYCKDILLKDGTVCASYVEAYYYLKLIEKGLKLGVDFKHNEKYDLSEQQFGKKRYDFFLHKENKYVEITSFNKTVWKRGWFKYLRRIVEKKRFVIEVLSANFEFISFALDTRQMRFVKSLME